MAITLATSIGTVTLKECYEDYEAGIDISRGPYLRKVYLCPSMASALPVCNSLMGIGLTPVAHACPESPNLRCLSATLSPEGEVDARDSGRPRFNLPKIQATYGLRLWDASDDPESTQTFPNETGSPYVYMEQSIEFDTEVIKAPGKAYRFPSDGKAIDTPFAITVAVAQFTIVRHYQSTLPLGNVATYLNKLNGAVFLGQPIGQIKFRKARTRREWTSDGTTSQMVEYVFQYREYDHNALHRPDNNTFELVKDSAGNNPYKYTDLTPLLS